MPTANEETAVIVEPDGTNSGLSVAREILSMALFDSEAMAVTETPTGALLAGFMDRPQAEAAVRTIAESFGSWATSVRIFDDAQHDWVTSQRGGFTPTKVGPWHIRTPWALPPEDIDPRHDIQIDPREAFGHGAHPSTRLALAMLTPHLHPTTSLLDVGTGTGVLAIAAARAGATVLAIDNSRAALEAAENNVVLNSMSPFVDVASRITLVEGGGDAVEVPPDHLVVANVTIDVHRTISPQFAYVHRLIASGLLCRHVRELQALYPQHRAKVITCVGEWASVELLLDQVV